ncbi:hypothetical protein BK139_21705 [Paenibacillus sp. FSL R5-0490]|uniref:hypothetical protein n=1 Tax=Bacillales TaxID=1385 RepID=UPI00096C6C93|nr:hypothetical protein [Paenibacillus sp. FSL R5-0490]OMF52919.1 hypothetical protein BK139_21705 [Paenibacillus sp. FSL R5-0490]
METKLILDWKSPDWGFSFFVWLDKAGAVGLVVWPQVRTVGGEIAVFESEVESGSDREKRNGGC